MATTLEGVPEQPDLEAGPETKENGGFQSQNNQDSGFDSQHTSEVDSNQPLMASPPDPLPNATNPKKKLTLTKQNGKVAWPDTQLEERMKKRFGMNRDGFLMCVGGIALLLLLLIVIIVLIALWPRSPYAGEICKKAACLRASSMILPALDDSVSPCTDLYTHACGGWNERYPKPPPTRARWDPKAELSLKLAEDVRDIVATLPYPTRVEAVTWRMKHIYGSCVALDNIENDNVWPLKKIINELGGWSVLREFSVLAWDFSQTLVKLHSKYGVDSFFRVAIIPDPYNSSRNVIELTPSELGLPDPQFYQFKEEKIPSSYRNYMKDAVQFLGATSTDAKTFSEDMFYFERRIAEALPPITELSDIRTHQMLNVSHLKIIAPSIPIHEILTALLPSANIGDGTLLWVKSARYMTSLSSIISTTDRSALNNYVMWQLTKSYLTYLSQGFQDIHFVYLRDTTGVTEPLERWEVCVNVLLRFQGVAVASRLQKVVPEAERVVRKALLDDMFDNLKWAVKDSVTKANWVDLELYQHIVKKLDGMKLVSGLSEDQMDDNQLGEFYNKLFVQKNDFFQNIRYGVEFLRDDMQRRYLHPKPEYTWIHDVMTPEVKYVPAINTILVPQVVLQEPWFHTDYPSGILYGGLGVEISRAILSAILPPHGLYAANGTLLPLRGLVANLTRSSIDNQLACLMGNSSAQGLSTFVTISGVRQALKALKRSIRGKSPIHQPGLEDLTDARLLVLRYTQSQCVTQTAQEIAIDVATTAPLRGSALLTEVSNNLKSFAEILGCSLPSSPCKHLL